MGQECHFKNMACGLSSGYPCSNSTVLKGEKTLKKRSMDDDDDGTDGYGWKLRKRCGGHSWIKIGQFGSRKGLWFSWEYADGKAQQTFRMELNSCSQDWEQRK